MIGWRVVRADGTVAKAAFKDGQGRPRDNARSWAAWLREFDADRAPFTIEKKEA